MVSASLGLTKLSKNMYFTLFDLANFTISASCEGDGSASGDSPAIGT